jgi:dihydrolipoamide dehydrogenase
MTPKEMPSKLLVIGSGAIGIEFASFYNDMGSEVTVVEMMDRIVPVEDADVSAFLEKALKKQGMTIMTGAGVEKIDVSAKRRQGRDQGQGRQGRHQRFQPRHRRGRDRSQYREHWS